MIRSFACSETGRFFASGKSRRLPPDILKRAAMRLTQLDGATRIEDLRLPPSNRLEALSHDRAGQWSIRITTSGVSASGSRTATPSTWKSSITTKETTMLTNNLPAIHPGEFLSEILTEMGISQAEFARAVGLSPMRISHVIKGTRPVTAELALLFGRAFDQTPQYWLNLQAAYDLKMAEADMGERLADVHSLAHA